MHTLYFAAINYLFFRKNNDRNFQISAYFNRSKLVVVALSGTCFP